ncbi:hypothetical protein KVR01_013310 [Diaporthe batatas]|uniref:uncharacterized protein n=1 Tax=Diaporthe batatas TaxID=748121 RepID=UPI001D038898|nr:uncharacterized protein KVR01_013310 [Diaporthe batatas]KAG8156897.1 hypothetical protein KVR01_013310 [Diaporthe batatas]
MANIATLDFAKFTHGTATERQHTGKALADSLIDHGFVKLVNHGLADETIADLIELLRRENIAGHDDLSKLLDARSCQRISLEIMAAIEVGLGLPPGVLVDRCRPDASEIRLNRYPPIPRAHLASGLVRRTWPHTDFGIITLLFQDHVGGLELEDRTSPGTFVPIAPVRPGQPAEMIVNASDTFERWTNSVVRPGLHQVAPPPPAAGDEIVLPERYSCVFFAKAGRETSAGPLPHFVSEENPARYDEITALQFQQRRTQLLY